MSLRGYLFLKLNTAKNGINSMSKKPCVKTLMDSQHVRGLETLHKSAMQYFGHIF